MRYPKNFILIKIFVAIRSGSSVHHKLIKQIFHAILFNIRNYSPEYYITEGE